MCEAPVPVAEAVRFPPVYGPAGEPAERLPWGFVEERLRTAPNYWLSTITPDGRPHARPVDGVWVAGALCFGGAPEARWAKNLATQPMVAVHVPSATEVVILEGTAEYVRAANHSLAALSAVASREKYPQYFSTDTTEPPPFQPFWALRPRTVLAWTLEGFPRNAARWTFYVKERE